MTQPTRHTRVDSQFPGSAEGDLNRPWPLLARLPQVGEPVLSATPVAVEANDLLDADPCLAQVAQLQSRTARRSAAPENDPQPPHLYHTPQSPPTLAVAERPAPTTTAPRRPTPQWRRIDPADHRGQATPMAAALRTHVAPAPAGQSLVGRALQWHAAMSPNVSAMIMAALLLSTGVLGWLTFGRSPATAPPPAANAESTAHALVPASPTTSTPDASSTETQPPTAESAVTAAPRSDAEAPMTGATPLADGQLAASSSDASGSAAPAVSELSATTPRAAAGEPRVDSAPQTPADSAPPSPITVPAAATMLPYPVTPYVNFDFGLYAPSDAGRTADGSAALPTSR